MHSGCPRGFLLRSSHSSLCSGTVQAPRFWRRCSGGLTAPLMAAQPRGQPVLVEEWRCREAINRGVMAGLLLHPHYLPQIALQVATSGEWLPNPRTAYSVVCCSAVCQEWMEPRIEEQQRRLREQLMEMMHQRILAQRRRRPAP